MDRNKPLLQCQLILQDQLGLAKLVEIYHLSRSALTYSPSSQQDYGTILCFANNQVGRQREPCQFHVIPAGKLGSYKIPHVVYPAIPLYSFTPLE